MKEYFLNLNNVFFLYSLDCRNDFDCRNEFNFKKCGNLYYAHRKNILTNFKNKFSQIFNHRSLNSHPIGFQMTSMLSFEYF